MRPNLSLIEGFSPLEKKNSLGLSSPPRARSPTPVSSLRFHVRLEKGCVPRGGVCVHGPRESARPQGHGPRSSEVISVFGQKAGGSPEVGLVQRASGQERGPSPGQPAARLDLPSAPEGPRRSPRVAAAEGGSNLRLGGLLGQTQAGQGSASEPRKGSIRGLGGPCRKPAGTPAGACRTGSEQRADTLLRSRRSRRLGDPGRSSRRRADGGGLKWFALPVDFGTGFGL